MHLAKALRGCWPLLHCVADPLHGMASGRGPFSPGKNERAVNEKKNRSFFLLKKNVSKERCGFVSSFQDLSKSRKKND